MARRKRILSARFDDGEAAVIIAAAALKSMTLSDWVRAALTAEAARVMGRHLGPAAHQPDGAQ